MQLNMQLQNTCSYISYEVVIVILNRRNINISETRASAVQTKIRFGISYIDYVGIHYFRSKSGGGEGL